MGILRHTKAVQITVDEELLARLDADEEVKALGRSAVMRRAVDEYLRHRQTARVDEAYRRAYGKGSAIEREWRGWEDEVLWPES